MKDLPRPIGEYPTFEELRHDYVHTDQFGSVSQEKRHKQLDKLKHVWMREHVAFVQQQADAAGTPNAPEQDITGKAKQVFESTMNFLAGPTITGPDGQPIDTNPGGRAINAAIGSFFPNNNKQAAIDAAMFAVGPEAVAGKAASNALYRLAMRVAIPAAAGAIGGASEGIPGIGNGQTDVLGGAASGATQQLVGEGITGAFRIGKRTIGAYDFARLQSWLESRLGVKVPDVKAFRRLFRNGDVLPPVEKSYKRTVNLYNQHVVTIPEAMKAHAAMNPSLGFRKTATLGEITNDLEQMEKDAWTARGDVNTSHQGRAIMDAVHASEGDIAEQLDMVDKKAAQDWGTARGKMRTARVLQHMLSEPGVLEMIGKDAKTGEMIDNGNISFEKLQKLVGDAGSNGYKIDLQQAMGPAEQRSLSKVLHRGETEGEEDRPGRGLFKSFSASSGGGERGWLQMPWRARHVGDVPFDLGRGRALSALITLGPHQMVQTINEMTSMPPMHINKTPAEAASTPAPSMPATSVVPADAVSK